MAERRRPASAALLLLCGLLLAVQLGCVAADDEGEAGSEKVLVTCGSTIKLESSNTRHVLHSHEVSYGYGRGSGQQSVTGFYERDSAGSLWTIKGCSQGTPIKPGQEIKLQHIVTRRWLHSHLFASPLSNNQEVSCFGDDKNTDSGDVWRVEWDGSAASWERDMPVRLLHKDTGAFLSTHAVKYQRPIPGHTEVMGMKAKGVHTLWQATEGVYWAVRKAE
ncbi:stromal cell-derived factor 2 [Chlorella sorokiniana]|uniref:Stromal cell-derived factor 2 n=1 Tax=Chlorella sorokiniana TaxID=3076 RepID=A0A2P6TDG9_CHLSO|nr:stromal cell-derived factor 2 [Chlorella sorokiniana]|eukprot:PRW20677.1 stromal cell-derived factor 2 [Chlorella sorokiniana]